MGAAVYLLLIGKLGGSAAATSEYLLMLRRKEAAK